MQQHFVLIDEPNHKKLLLEFSQKWKYLQDSLALLLVSGQCRSRCDRSSSVLLLLLEVFTPYRHHGDPGAQDQNLESETLTWVIQGHCFVDQSTALLPR